mgnify:CR=1 FL=1
MEYKVALCDDDKIISSKIMAAFNNELHAHNLEATIDYYSSGDVLIEAAKEKHYNLALLDIDMTPLNGFDTAQSICSISSDTRIVFVTSHEELVFDTFDLAIERNPSASPLLHSDRGYQYTSKAFKLKLDKVSATQSMSRVGRCIDNGPIEGFWGIIKSEMYYLRKFDNFDELKLAIDNYIEFYNNKRLQKKLKGLSPIEYRAQTLVA